MTLAPHHVCFESECQQPPQANLKDAQKWNFQYCTVGVEESMYVMDNHFIFLHYFLMVLHRGRVSAKIDR